MKISLVVLFLAVLSSGCNSFVYKDRSYRLAEAALGAQQRDLEKEVGEVTPVLKERRLGGTATVVTPDEIELRRVLHPNAGEDADSQAFYATSLVLNEARALGDALAKSGLVDSVTHESVKVIGTASLATARTEWLFVFTHSGRDTHWLMGKRSGAGLERIAFTAADQKAPDRMDKFVAAAFETGKKSATSRRPADAVAVPEGWQLFTLPPGENPTCRSAFPRTPNVKRTDVKVARTWTATTDAGELGYRILATQANPGVVFDPGVEGSRRDELRDTLGLEILSEENDAEGSRAKWVHFRVKGASPERHIVARIVRTERWLAASYVEGLLARVFDPTLSGGSFRQRLSSYSRVFLDSLTLRE